MKRPLKRYNSRREILSAIDDEQHNLANSTKLAGQYELEIEQLKKWFAANPLEDNASQIKLIKWHGHNDRLKLCKEEMKAHITSIPLHHSKLIKLKHTLAEFDTQPMPFLNDESVQQSCL